MRRPDGARKDPTTVTRLRRVGTSPEEFEADLLDNLFFQRGTTTESASRQDVYQTLAMTVRDRLVGRHARTAAAHFAANPRFVYYPSAGVMLGPQPTQNLLYTGTADAARAPGCSARQPRDEG